MEQKNFCLNIHQRKTSTTFIEERDWFFLGSVLLVYVGLPFSGFRISAVWTFILGTHVSWASVSVDPSQGLYYAFLNVSHLHSKDEAD